MRINLKKIKVGDRFYGPIRCDKGNFDPRFKVREIEVVKLNNKSFILEHGTKRNRIKERIPYKGVTVGFFTTKIEVWKDIIRGCSNWKDEWYRNKVLKQAKSHVRRLERLEKKAKILENKRNDREEKELDKMLMRYE